MSTLLIRQATESDAAGFLELWDYLDTETEYMLFEPDERKATLDAQQTRLANAASSPYAHIIVLEDNTKKLIAGFCAGRRSSNVRDKHSLEVVVGIRQSYTGNKWGHKLLTELEKWAHTMDISRMELNVMVNNHHAITLYKRLGYDIEGTKRKSVCLRSGFVDEHVMSKLL